MQLAISAGVLIMNTAAGAIQLGNKVSLYLLLFGNY
jgi:hypothetical protein